MKKILNILLLIIIVLLVSSCGPSKAEYKEKYITCSQELIIAQNQNNELIAPPSCSECNITECVQKECPRCEPQLIKQECPKVVQKHNIPKAEWYIELGTKQSKEFWVNFNNKKYKACKDKLNTSYDHFLVATALYKQSENELNNILYQAYDDYTKAINYIRTYCIKTDDGKEVDKDIIYNYNKWYERYAAHIEQYNLVAQQEVELIEKYH